VGERKKEREKEREGEKERVMSRIVIFIFKGMAGALAPFSYLVLLYPSIYICLWIMLP
jgi:hypothetical protein